MLSDEKLQEIAHDECLTHAADVLTGDLLVELGEPDLEWDPIELRHVFDQPMVIWRGLEDYEVILDDDDRPVGFMDPTAAADCAWDSLSAEDALAIVTSSGWVSGALELVGGIRRGAGDSADFVIRDLVRPAEAERLLVRINPAKRTVISILPEGMSRIGS